MACAGAGLLATLQRRFLAHLLALGLLLAVLPLHAQEAAVSPPPLLALVTFGPGPLYWERFGHNALLVREVGGGEALLYNYGVFDFHQSNFFLNFARGQMRYRLAVQRFADAIPQYAAESRWLRVQQLDLEPEQARRLAAFLAWNARPENVEYRYDYFIANCSTRVRDALDMATGGELRSKLQAQPAGRSYRFEATRLMAPELPLALGMDLIMGPAGDRPIDRWQQSFVPMVLMDAVRGLQLRRADGSTRPLIQRDFLLLDDSRWPEPQRPLPLLWPMAVLGVVAALLLLALAALRMRRLPRYALAVLAALSQLKLGLIGIVMLSAWALTAHWAMWANHNLLLFNPLGLLLLPTWFASIRPDWRARRWQLALSLLIAAGGLLALLWQVLPGAQQDLPWIAAVLPVQLALAAIVWRASRR